MKQFLKNIKTAILETLLFLFSLVVDPSEGTIRAYLFAILAITFTVAILMGKAHDLLLGFILFLMLLDKALAVLAVLLAPKQRQ